MPLPEKKYITPKPQNKINFQQPGWHNIMKHLYAILAVILTALIISASFYGAYVYLQTSPTPPTTTDKPLSTPATSNGGPTSQPNTFPTATPDLSITMPPTSSLPTPTTAPTNIIVEDDLGVFITIPLPVNRIIALDSAHIELLCALGAQNMIVGRGSYCNFPPSINDTINVGSYVSPSVETIIQLQPDVIFTSATCDALVLLQNAGIPVVVQNLANTTMLVPAIEFLGQLVNSQENATTLINWINHYTNLVTSRVATLSPNQIPTFYAEYNIDWQSMGSQNVVGQLVAATGGINIFNSSAANTVIVSPESVLQQNPQYIFKLTASTEAVDASYYQNILSSINTRNGFSDVAAVKSGNVYVFDYTIISGLRYPVGMLYFAKSMHPDLFTDVEPAAILSGMIKQFFGFTLPGVYLYP
jgi:iron complex transport system substrate-binding protein